MYQSDKRLCLDSAREKIVDCDSSDAAFLLVAEGGEIPDEEARKYGLVGGIESKAVAEPPANKAVKGAANKAAKDRD
jgi:hypothetical protein